MTNRPALYGFLFLPLLACAGNDEQEGLSGGEEQQLEDAAAALDEAQAEFETAIQQPPETEETDEQSGH